jgi:hypothetical protein
MTTGRDDVVATLRRLRNEWADGEPEGWKHWTIPGYLDAMAAWLEVFENAYTNSGRAVPTDGWEVFNAALNAAAICE